MQARGQFETARARSALGLATTRLVEWARSFPGQDRKRHDVLTRNAGHARIVGGAPAKGWRLTGRDHVLKTRTAGKGKKTKTAFNKKLCATLTPQLTTLIVGRVTPCAPSSVWRGTARTE